ncbi:MAG TPA: Stp1/IreP family PP2C-type Ser/Thr phosphatase [Solirubrobacteraceae bacterium]|nr:Stp1/IreP family PP2C-type Ser/Thr phosphatase [Solirubrobacteraceae bacterium]
MAEHWYGSDVGRQRQGNEDNFFVQSPLFVVADGMGGAQAGEVAAQMAVEAFRDGLGDGAALDGLVETIRRANRHIHDASRSEAQHQGMGTTCTAIYVGEDEVALAHVGDSRCYLFRDGDLTRLTRDHSLVGELIDRGKLTEEQAEVHPQRSVITRALGAEPDVRVDTERVEARGGDLFLLCSDGLTSMIREPALVAILQEGESLETTGRRLIAAANDAGGRDNITVVLLRIDEVEVGGASAGATAERAALPADESYEDYAPAGAGGGPAGPAGRTQATAPDGAPATAEVAAAVRAADAAEADYRRHGTVAMPAVGPRSEPEPLPSAPPPRRATPAPSAKRPRRRRRIGPLLVVLALAAIIGVSAFVAMRGVFFVGLDSQRSVTIFRGLPYELPLGIDLYSRHYTSGVTIDQVPPNRRATFTDHKLRSLDDASDLVRQLETGRLGR